PANQLARVAPATDPGKASKANSVNAQVKQSNQRGLARSFVQGALGDPNGTATPTDTSTPNPATKPRGPMELPDGWIEKFLNGQAVLGGLNPDGTTWSIGAGNTPAGQHDFIGGLFSHNYLLSHSDLQILTDGQLSNGKSIDKDFARQVLGVQAQLT